MQVTPENVATLMQGATPTQIVILIMLGLLIAGAIYIVVEKMINSRLKPFEQIPEQLEEILGCLRSILSAEVKEEPLGEIRLLGLDSAGLRRVSHHVQEEIGIPHPVPSYRMGPTVAALNYLRTQVRETELAAALAFDSPQGCTRRDVVEALNRLSSAVYILLCRYLAQQQK